MSRSKWWMGTAALLALAGWASAAAADVDVQAGNPNTKVTFNYTCPPAGPASEVVFNGPGNYGVFRTYCVFPNQVSMRADRQGNRVGDYVIARGNSAGGGIGTEALNDSAYAEDSLTVDVIRTVPGVVTMNFVYGKMINNPGLLVARPVRNRVKVLVYQNDAAANADPGRVGTGAVFNGTVSLVANAGTPLTLTGGFSGADWVLTSGPGGQVIATAAGGLTKNVNVTDSNAAAVVLLSDPVSGYQAPGAQPIGIGIIALLLLGSGLWFMRARRDGTAT